MQVKRPRVDDEEVVKVAVSKVYDRLVEWLDDDDERKERQFTQNLPESPLL